MRLRYLSWWLYSAFLARAETGYPQAEIKYLVRTQKQVHDTSLFEALQAALVDEGEPYLNVISMAEAMNVKPKHRGLWTYKPWIWNVAHEREATKRGQEWFVFLEPTTMVSAKQLRRVLSNYDSRKPYYIGRGLTDTERSIVHHYSTSPSYANVRSGFALSAGAVEALADDMKAKPLGSGQQIEPVWELAKMLEMVAGTKITSLPSSFCLDPRGDCATWLVPRMSHRTSFGLKHQDVVIAVKTVDKFHPSRIPVIHDTWGKDSPIDVLYMSNAPDKDGLGVTIVDLSKEFGDAVDPAKEATKEGSGHCSKMESLLKHLMKHVPDRRWYVVVDDDTLLNVPMLFRVLDSHDDTKPAYMGERYGWAHRENHPGINYITTGGGMALNAAALKSVNDCFTDGNCKCRSPNAPDDMTLGQWFLQLGDPIQDEEGFHQSEPENYHPELLIYGDPNLSFHRYGPFGRGHKDGNDDKLLQTRKDTWAQWKSKYFTVPPASISAEL